MLPEKKNLFTFVPLGPFTNTVGNKLYSYAKYFYCFDETIM